MTRQEYEKAIMDLIHSGDDCGLTDPEWDAALRSVFRQLYPMVNARIETKLTFPNHEAMHA